jgi:cytochrome c553
MLTKKLIIAAMFLLMLLAGNVQAGGDATRGEELAVDCADCHGDDGLGDEDVPAIAGMDAADQVKELMAFKSGEREDEEEDMVDSVEDLNEQDMADLAAYFSTLPGPKE